jgi:hypothetical protein
MIRHIENTRREVYSNTGLRTDTIRKERKHY